MQRRLSLAFTLMTTGKIILAPTLGKLFIYSCLGLFFTKTYSIDFINGIVWSVLVYDGFGAVLILLSLLLGGKMLLLELNTQISLSARRAVKYL